MKQKALIRELSRSFGVISDELDEPTPQAIEALAVMLAEVQRLDALLGAGGELVHQYIYGTEHEHETQP